MAAKDVYSANKIFHYKDSLIKILKGETVSPVKLHIDLTNNCNNMCIWCFYNIHELSEFSRKDSLKEKTVFDILESFKKVGGKSIEWTGGGEPTTSPHFLSVIKRAGLLGLGQALVTNGKRLKGVFAEGVKNFDWVRVSLDSASPETYKRYHGNDSFDRVIKNLKNFARIKSENCSFGISMIIDGHNYVDMVEVVRIAKELGVNTVRISLAVTPEKEKIFGEDWSKVLTLMNEARKYENSDFKVFAMDTRINNLAQKTGGGRCYYHHLAASIGGNGAVYPCCHFKYLPEYNLGNVNNTSFKNIWYGDKRKKFIETTGENCNASCWMTEKNELARYIVKDPGEVTHLTYL